MTEASDALPLAAADWLTTGPVAKLLGVLNSGGEEARVIGGAVRNALLGVPVADVDIATTALPDEVARRAAAAGFKAVPTGIAHGTITVVIGGRPIEVTTLRTDVETFGRHATVQFGRDWKADAARRDFTMNALSAAADGTLYDYVGGRSDLDARRVRFIGDPAARIAEDYLRILRFFRFYAAYGVGELDAAAMAACTNARDGLARLSRERVRMELLKLLAAPRAAAALEAMSDAGVLVPVLGGVPLSANFRAMTALEERLALASDPIRRLAALAVLVTEDADRLSERLRLANAERERLLSMADGWWQISPLLGERGARALLYRLGPSHFLDRVLKAWAHSGTDGGDPDWRALARLPQRWTAPVFPLKAADFIRRGVEKGPALGAALRAAEAAWIAADFPADAAGLADIIKAATAL